jgi:hypothetical protein
LRWVIFLAESPSELFFPGGRPRPRFAGADFSATTLRGRPRGRLALVALDFFALGLGGRPRCLGFLAADLAGFFEGLEVFDFLGKAIFG